MKSRRVLPIPFLILILAGLVSLVSLFAEREPRSGTANDDSLQVQTVEQERMVATYFRVKTWLSSLTNPRESQPAHANQPTSNSPQLGSVPGHLKDTRSLEFCAMHLKHEVAVKLRHDLN